jgi:hypothetical protein
MTEQTILPCPFCGSECKVTMYGYAGGMVCTQTGCPYNGPVVASGVGEVIELHNRIAAMPGRIEELQEQQAEHLDEIRRLMNELAKLRTPESDTATMPDGTEVNFDTRSYSEPVTPDKSDRWWSVFNAALTGLLSDPEVGGPHEHFADNCAKYADAALARANQR